MVVNILRVGRLGMFFQSKDERKTGYYDTETGSWEELGGGYRVTVRDGIRTVSYTHLTLPTKRIV